jgi:lipoate-protein ligase A
MAADEVLLEAAVAGVASLRFYGWAPATLSLGYFQPEACRRTDPRLTTLPWVRRASGGSALVHHHEITYALALPTGLPWQRRGENWTCRMHGIIAAALATFGVAVRACACGEEQKQGGVLCFLHQTPGDLLLGPHKVVGSAQRKQRGALLQHGGILLAASPHAPALPGIAELSGVRLSVAETCAALCEHFARDTGWILCEGVWTEAERRRGEELSMSKYASAAWNCKR